MTIVLYTVLTLVGIGLLCAGVLYVVAARFRVEEDPRIDQVEKLLPGANCGGCGQTGCRAFAEAFVVEQDADLYCPVGGAETMTAVAKLLGRVAVEKDPIVATIRCGGSCQKRPRTNVYDGAHWCATSSALYAGQTACAFGCMGFGDCAEVCHFDALRINEQTGLPEVDADKCTACGACVRACPKGVIELRKKWPKHRAVYVSCISRDRGAATRKACSAGCIGCGKCVKECAFEAITLADNLAFIDSSKCKLCRKCVGVCPTGAIVLKGMEPLKS